MFKDGYPAWGHQMTDAAQLYLSEKGKALFDEVQPAFNQKIVELMSLIDSDKIDPYLRVSQSIEHILASARQTPLL